MNETTLKQLYEPITKKERQGPGGKMYEYTPSQDVINRMNRTFKGNWSTEVTKQQIFEDQVLVRVTVTATDPGDETLCRYSHDGYGSSLIARYSYGDNKDKAMDIGNIFKSAEAKAIVNACRRFGVSLLDTVPISPTKVTIPDGFAGHETAPAPAPTPAPETEVTPGALDMSRVEEMKASMAPIVAVPEPEKKETVVPEMSVIELPTPVPPTPEPATVTAVQALFPPPTVEPPVESPFTTTTVMPPEQHVPLAGHLEPNKPGTVSDVQMAALTGFVELKGFNYQVLSQSAFMEAGLPIDAIPEPKSLSYNQAVIIIKHGNAKQRENM